VILFLDICAKECKSGYNRDTCTPMFITALFTIDNLWKQPKYCTTDEWIEKMWYICTMEFYSAIRNKYMWFEHKWIQLEDIMLSEVNQAQKDKGCIFFSHPRKIEPKDKYKHKNKHAVLIAMAL
jgi:hypothetical protein